MKNLLLVGTNRTADRFMSENKILSYKPLSSLEPLINTVGRIGIKDQNQENILISSI